MEEKCMRRYATENITSSFKKCLLNNKFDRLDDDDLFLTEKVCDLPKIFLAETENTYMITCRYYIKTLLICLTGVSYDHNLKICNDCIFFTEFIILCVLIYIHILFQNLFKIIFFYKKLWMTFCT